MKYNLAVSIDMGSQGKSFLFLIHKTPVWKVRLWESYQQNLSFMTPIDEKFPSETVVVGTIMVDGEQYVEVEELEECRIYTKTWHINPAEPWMLYIHFAQSRPPTTFYYIQIGTSYLFSLYQIKNNAHMLPILINTPTIQRSADLLEYNKVKLASINVDLNNTYKDLDNFPLVFGFNIRLYAGAAHEEFSSYHKLAQFIISEYNRGINQVSIKGKDKRESWSRKAPNKRLRISEPANDKNKYIPGEVYPFLNPDLNHELIPDAYGYCFQVEGICLNENEALNNRWRHFKFARDISNTIWSPEFILEAEIGGKWVKLPRDATEYAQVFTGLGQRNENPVLWDDAISAYNLARRASGPSKSDLDNETVNMLEIFVNGMNVTYHNGWTIPEQSQHNVSFYERGVVSIPVIWAHDQSNEVSAEDTLGGINRVRLTAYFNNVHPNKTNDQNNNLRGSNPGDIIKDILYHYGEVIPASSNYILDEWENELRKLDNVGIVLNKEKTCLDWVRDIQNTSTLGFQVFIDFRGITARVANPNRSESFRIGLDANNPILNKDEISINYNGSDYATYAEVEYAFREEGDLGDRVIDDRWKMEMISRHIYDKVYFNSSRLRTEAQAKMKAYAVMQQYHNGMIGINGIEVFGEQNFNIWPYDTGWIDIKELTPFFPNRSTNLRVMVTNIKITPSTGRIILDVMLCDRIEGLPSEYGEGPQPRDFMMRVDEQSNLLLEDNDNKGNPMKLNNEKCLFYTNEKAESDVWLDNENGDLFMEK